MKFKNFLFSYYKSLIVFILIFFASTLPAEEVQKVTWFSIPNLDKLVHLVMYSLLSFLLIWDMQKAKSNYSFAKIILVSGFIAIIYGALIEILQMTLTNSRSGDVFDFLFNTSGVSLSIVLWMIFKKTK